MRLFKKYGPWACVAGAAEGLGAAFATQLAQRGFSLIVIDQNQEALLKLEHEIKEKHSISMISLAYDLGERACLAPIMQTIQKVNARFLIYNAAYGPVRPFLSNTPEQLDAYLKVNMETPLHLAHQFCEHYQKQEAGMLWLASLAGFRGTQFVVPYAATKAFSWNIAEGLYYEFKHTGLDFSVCCPGATDTPGFQSTNPQPHWLAPKPMASELVAKEALNKFGKKLMIIPGFSNKLSHLLLNRILPRRWASGLHNAVMKGMYGER